MAPWLAVFIDPVDQESAMYNNFRLFGTGLLCIMGMTTEQLYTNVVYYYNYYDYMSIAQVQSYLSASSLSINSRLSPWPVSYSPSSRCTSAFLTISTETINYGKCRRHFMVAKRNGGAYAKRIKRILRLRPTCTGFDDIVFFVCICFYYRLCVLGKRLLKDIDPANCTKEIGGPLHNLYCNSTSSSSCEDYYKCKDMQLFCFAKCF